MNIQRFKWPVMVAAGLHGALLMVTPAPRTIRDPEPEKPEILPRKPEEELIQIYDFASDSDATPAGGGAAVPTLPDPVAALPDAKAFTMATVDPIRVVRLENTLERFTGGDGPGVGPVQFPSGTTIPAAKLDRQPRATVQLAPGYPPVMRHQGIAGSVLVEFDVNKEGVVVRAEVVRCSREEFAEPALRAVRRWRFEPGRRDGRVVPFRMIVPIEFNLNE